MEIRRLGVEGPELSVVGLGCNNFGGRIDQTQTERVVSAALDAGISHFDTAESYGDGRSEVILRQGSGRETRRGGHSHQVRSPAARRDLPARAAAPAHP